MILSLNMMLAVYGLVALAVLLLTTAFQVAQNNECFIDRASRIILSVNTFHLDLFACFQVTL